MLGWISSLMLSIQLSRSRSLNSSLGKAISDRKILLLGELLHPLGKFCSFAMGGQSFRKPY